MLSYFLEGTKNTESKKPKVVRGKMEECFFQNVQCVIVKNRKLLKNKKLKDY